MIYKLLFQIRLFIAIMAGTSTVRVTRSSSGNRNMIEIPGGEKSEPLSPELIKSLLCMGFGRPVWEKLQQSHGAQTSTGTWATVATKISPGAVLSVFKQVIFATDITLRITSTNDQSEFSTQYLYLVGCCSYFLATLKTNLYSCMLF